MSRVIPSTFPFRFAMPIPYCPAIPAQRGRLLDLHESARLFRPGSDFQTEDCPVEVRIGWNEHGMGIACTVRKKQHPPVANPEKPESGDVFRFWIHTRSVREIHRANRMCHQFCLFPNGGGDNGLQPLIRQLPIPRSAEDPPRHPPQSFRAWSATTADGYIAEAWLPEQCLFGFEPEYSPQLGFYWELTDLEHGTITLGVDAEFPYATDPSQWHLIELQSSPT